MVIETDESFSPLEPFHCSPTESSVGNTDIAGIRPVAFRSNRFGRRRRAQSFALQDFHDSTDPANNETGDKLKNSLGCVGSAGPDLNEVAAQLDETGNDDALVLNGASTLLSDADGYNGRRRRVKRSVSRIARPRDSMPGYKKRPRSAGRGFSSKRQKHGPNVAIKKHVDRGISLAAYYGTKDLHDFDTYDDVQYIEKDCITNPVSCGGPSRLVDAFKTTDAPNCDTHGLPSLRYQVKKSGLNKGRYFFKCGHKKLFERCRFFVWENELKRSLSHEELSENAVPSMEIEAMVPFCENLSQSRTVSDRFECWDPIENLIDAMPWSGFTSQDMSVAKNCVAVAPACVESPIAQNLTDDEYVLSASRNIECDLKDILRNLYGFEDFRPGQLSIIRRILCDTSTLAVLPTGGGKSICFQMFAAIRRGTVLVVTPLVSLMLNQLETLPNCIPGACLRSGQHSADTVDVEKRFLSGKLKILFVSPERLFTERFQNLILKSPANAISLTVVDEAHCISQMGHNFRSSYLRLSRLLDCKKDNELSLKTTVLAMTATATKTVVDDICSKFSIQFADVVTAETKRSHLRLTVSKVNCCFERKVSELVGLFRSQPFSALFRSGASDTLSSSNEDLCPGKDPNPCNIDCGEEVTNHSESNSDCKSLKSAILYEMAVNDINEHGARPLNNDAKGCSTVIVYVTKQRECESLCNYLRTSRLSTAGRIDKYHAGMNAEARKIVQHDFSRQRISILIATVAFGMGIDSKHVRGVIHFNAPFSVEAYSQEIGRAGRDGRFGACHVFVDQSDVNRLTSRAHSDGIDLGTVRQLVRQILGYGNTHRIPQSAESNVKNWNEHASDWDATSAEIAQCDDDDKISTSSDRYQNPVADDVNYSNTSRDTFPVFIPYRYVERVLDIRRETCETICAYIECKCLDFKFSSNTHNVISLKFFNKTPAQLLDSGDHLVDELRPILSHIVENGTFRAGRFEVSLYFAINGSEKQSNCVQATIQPRNFVSGARFLKHRKLADFELLEEGIIAMIPNSLTRDSRRIDEIAACCHADLTRAEHTRRLKVDALISTLNDAENMPSVELQSQYLHDTLRNYFSETSKATFEESQTGLFSDDGVVKTIVARRTSFPNIRESDVPGLVSSIRRTMKEHVLGHRRATTARQVARILHGLSSPAFPAKEWCKSDLWGRFVHVDFRLVKRMAGEVISRARL